MDLYTPEEEQRGSLWGRPGSEAALEAAPAGGSARVASPGLAVHPAAVEAGSTASPRGRPLGEPARPLSSRTRSGLPVPRLAALGLAGLDLAAAGVALALAYILRFETRVGALGYTATAAPAEYAKLFVVIAAAIAVLAPLHHLYRLDGVHTTLEETAAVAKVVTLATGFGLAGTFFYRDSSFSRVALVYFLVLSITFMAIAHAVFRFWLVGRYARGLDRQRTLVVGEAGNHFLERLQQEPVFGVEVVGWLGDVRGGAGDGPTPEPRRAGVLVRSAKASRCDTSPRAVWLGAIGDAAAILDGGAIDQVIIVEQGLTHEQLLEVLDVCERHDVCVRLIPPIYDLLVHPSDLTFIDGVPLMRLDEAPLRRGRETTKRAFDIVASGALILLFSPLLLTIAALIRWTSPGPVLFRQVRAGKAGRPFEMLKFRTMVCDAERRLGELVDVEQLAEPVFKIVGDPRITPMGRILRRFSLDELPQLLNVFRGEMAIVGPRPEEVGIAGRYDTWQRRRLKVKPGITGLQQVVARGALSNLNERVRLDVYYTRKQSFLFDLVILARTVGVVLTGRGAT